MAGLSALGRVYPKKTCDVCGQYKHARPGEFRMVKGRVVCSDHPDYVPLEVADAAPVKVFKVKAVANARPFSPNDTYEAAEMELFDYLAANYRTVDSEFLGEDYIFPSGNDPSFSSGVAGAAWSAIYFYHLVVEDKRPRRVVSIARNKVREIANWLLTRQWGAPHNSSILNNGEHGWGGYATDGTILSFADNVEFITEDCVAAGIAMLRAYQLFGDTRYLESARATAWFVRSSMCSGKLLFGRHTSSDAAGFDRKHMGAVSPSTSYVGTYPQHSLNFTFDGAIALEFMRLFLDVAGDGVIGSPSLLTGYDESREALASVALAEMLAFYKNGTYDSVRGSVVNGLSVTTPFYAFESFPLGSNTWTWASSFDLDARAISGTHWARAIRGLRAAEGDSARVLELFDWLMSFGSNSANQLAAVANRMSYGAGEKEQWASDKGVYDPTFALADFLKVQSIATGLATKTEVSGATYSPVTVGLLAPLFSARQRASFKRYKDEVGVPRRLTKGGAGDGLRVRPLMLSAFGLGMQPLGSDGFAYRYTFSLAMAGLIYRQPPQAFAERGH